MRRLLSQAVGLADRARQPIGAVMIAGRILHDSAFTVAESAVWISIVSHAASVAENLTGIKICANAT